MNCLDKKVLALLQEDCRYDHARIATMLGVSKEEIDDTIKSLEDKGVIVKYTAIINEDKMDVSPINALIEVRVTPQNRCGFDAIAEEIMNFAEVKAVYLMSGVYDLSIAVETESMRDLSLFVSEKLSTIDSIVGVATHFIMKKYKDGGIILDKGDNSTRLPIHE
ncbi:MAG: Lrp/AsnC family transcriptional regulator [Clostridia bacterium]|nr:Lrp/AsnC family transcriptional regulator [Clostridia bacterium]MBR7159695.1 Lrp/AsnC family transcriptional regulator [Clostridia bacterium]